MLQRVFLPENLHLDDCIKRKNRNKHFQLLAGEIGVEGQSNLHEILEFIKTGDRIKKCQL